MSKLPLASMEKMLKEAGANRVSQTAATQLQKHLIEVAEKVCKRAIQNANHAGRKTVKDKDVALATRS